MCMLQRKNVRNWIVRVLMRVSNILNISFKEFLQKKKHLFERKALIKMSVGHKCIVAFGATTAAAIKGKNEEETKKDPQRAAGIQTSKATLM